MLISGTHSRESNFQSWLQICDTRLTVIVPRARARTHTLIRYRREIWTTEDSYIEPTELFKIISYVQPIVSHHYSPSTAGHAHGWEKSHGWEKWHGWKKLQGWKKSHCWKKSHSVLKSEAGQLEWAIHPLPAKKWILLFIQRACVLAEEAHARFLPLFLSLSRAHNFFSIVCSQEARGCVRIPHIFAGYASWGTIFPSLTNKFSCVAAGPPPPGGGGAVPRWMIEKY